MRQFAPLAILPYAGKDMRISKLNVLLAEDDENDIVFFKRAFEKVEHPVSVQIVRDGEEAIAYLRGAGQFNDREAHPFPTVLMLDLKMPKVDGLGVLRWIVDNPDCKVLPAIIFSSSAREQDIEEAYHLRVNTYFAKPTSFHELVPLIESIFIYWSKSHVPNPPANKRCA